MHIKVLGSGCKKCHQTAALIEEIVKSLHVEATVEHVNDLQTIMKYRVMSTPAVVIDEKTVCVGRVPTKDEITQWVTSPTA